jgi:hypothetical protein
MNPTRCIVHPLSEFGFRIRAFNRRLIRDPEFLTQRLTPEKVQR